MALAALMLSDHHLGSEKVAVTETFKPIGGPVNVVRRTKFTP
jgi:hypothetical protein